MSDWRHFDKSLPNRRGKMTNWNEEQGIGERSLLSMEMYPNHDELAGHLAIAEAAIREARKKLDAPLDVEMPGPCEPCDPHHSINAERERFCGEIEWCNRCGAIRRVDENGDWIDKEWRLPERGQ